VSVGRPRARQQPPVRCCTFCESIAQASCPPVCPSASLSCPQFQEREMPTRLSANQGRRRRSNRSALRSPAARQPHRCGSVSTPTHYPPSSRRRPGPTHLSHRRKPNTPTHPLMLLNPTPMPTPLSQRARAPTCRRVSASPSGRCTRTGQEPAQTRTGTPRSLSSLCTRSARLGPLVSRPLRSRQGCCAWTLAERRRRIGPWHSLLCDGSSRQCSAVCVGSVVGVLAPRRSTRLCVRRTRSMPATGRT
jgi:hypothetical protein